MRSAKWKDYELIDASRGERLERFNDIILIRPDPQIIWNTERLNSFWKNANAKYVRSKTGGGHWEEYKATPEVWQLKYKDIRFNIKKMGFKHTGVFPEQAVNWDFTMDLIKNSKRQLNILNLFAYTGGATMACLKAGAKVCHVDASKGMVSWAKENVKLSGMSDKPVRYIVDDCIKFVKREHRRGNKYDGIIMDPPSYGRGPSGEVWRLEDNLFDLIELTKTLLSEDAKFFILNSYTSGLSASVMEYMLNVCIKKYMGKKVFADELGIPVTSSGNVLPCGSTAIWADI